MSAGDAGAQRRDFVEVAPGVHVLRYPVLDVNISLVVGERSALLVDTLSTPAQADELAAAVARVTDLPLQVVNTHVHFDHCFGNARFAEAGTPIWAHEACIEGLRRYGTQMQEQVYTMYAERRPELADGVAAVRIVLPDRAVRDNATVDLGGRTVELRYAGRAHTDTDLAVVVPDADVLIVGDLVEQGAPPAFGDSFPLEWPETLAALLRTVSPDAVVVPGHGAVVDMAFARAQHADLAALDWAIRDGHADGASPAEVAERAPFPVEAALPAVERGYAELSGRA